MKCWLAMFARVVVPLVSVSEALAEVWPGQQWETATPAQMGMDGAKLDEAVAYAGGSGYIVRGGKLVRAWGDPNAVHDLKSTSKSIGSITFALAIGDGTLSLDDLAQAAHPSFGIPPQANASTGWLPHIELRQLATQTAGFAKPGGYEPLLFPYGTRWHYSDGGPNWLAEITTLAHGQDLEDVLFDRVLTRMDVTPADLWWRSNWYRGDTIQGIKNREFGSGIHANVDALARIGYLFLRDGEWDGEQVVPASYIAQARVPQPDVVGLPEHDPASSFDASEHYGLLWWNNGDATLAGVPTDSSSRSRCR
jgi:CubicO group peptidase (beta-lactamase class C family)